MEWNRETRRVVQSVKKTVKGGSGGIYVYESKQRLVNRRKTGKYWWPTRKTEATRKRAVCFSYREKGAGTGDRRDREVEAEDMKRRSVGFDEIESGEKPVYDMQRRKATKSILQVVL